MAINPAMPILVVDDFPLVAATIAGLLRAEGFHSIDLAYGGAGALEQMQEKAYGLVISDLKMPGVDGLELFHVMKDRDELADTGFVLFTGHKDATTLEAAKSAGVDAVMTKPITAEALNRVISDVFSTREQRWAQ